MARPTPEPTKEPTAAMMMTMQPTGRPTRPPRPTPEPTKEPTAAMMTPQPTGRPTRPPRTDRPTPRPTRQPVDPTPMTMRPTARPTRVPTTPGPTAPRVCDPPISPEQRRAELLEIVLTISSAEDLADSGSSQSEAFEWLANDDEAAACPENELEVVQRYVSALLYFATSGDGWTRCNAASSPSLSPCPTVRFLAGTNVCRWSGVACDAPDGVVEGYAIGKSQFY